MKKTLKDFSKNALKNPAKIKGGQGDDVIDKDRIRRKERR